MIKNTIPGRSCLNPFSKYDVGADGFLSEVAVEL